MPLTPVHERAWDLTPAAAHALQAEAAGQVELANRCGPISLVAGIDVGFERGGTLARAAVVALRLADLEAVDHAIVRRPTAFQPASGQEPSAWPRRRRAPAPGGTAPPGACGS